MQIHVRYVDREIELKSLVRTNQLLHNKFETIKIFKSPARKSAGNAQNFCDELE